MIKEEVRIIAWDDCCFEKSSKEVLVVGVVFRGGKFLDGMLSTKIEKDGMDVTGRISEAIKKSRHLDQLSIIMLDGITFGGFNLIDIQELYNETGLPVIVVQRKKPAMEKFLSALKIFEDHSERKETVEKAGQLYKFNKIYYQKYGIGKEECERILKMTCVRSDVPEPLRVAHLIASGFSGESRGRA